MTTASAFVPFHRLSRGMRGVGTVYAIESDDGFVKIGFTIYSAQARCSSLQIANPHRLSVVGEFAGTVEIEKAIHRRLAKYRVSGEWFRVDVKPFFAEMQSLQEAAA